MTARKTPHVKLSSPEIYFNRELSWLSFARRVLAQAERGDLPLLERVKFVGIVGMLHDEFFMKRMSGLKRQVEQGSKKPSLDGRLPKGEFAACRKEMIAQVRTLSGIVSREIRPALARENLPVLDHDELEGKQRKKLRKYFRETVMPGLTPLAVDSEHPFPFVGNLSLSLAVVFRKRPRRLKRIVLMEVPSNQPRWIPVPDGVGFTPLEQVIAANLDLLYRAPAPEGVHLFRVTRGAEGDASDVHDLPLEEPGSIVQQVSSELKARRFAGVVRLQIDASMPKSLRRWLQKQLRVNASDIYVSEPFQGIRDLAQIPAADRDDLRLAPHVPVVHPRLRELDAESPEAFFREISRGDILLHHPYHCFDTSVLRFIESAARDPAVTAIKLTIYRTSPGVDSPILGALIDAARRGKQVAVLVEITARFDEAPNIAWGRMLENEGVHVAYGVESLKTHVKLALVVRKEGEGVRQYAHLGTGNYHPGTARVYEDLGMLTSEPSVCAEVGMVFNALTGAVPYEGAGKLIVAPMSMRRHFTRLIRREAAHGKRGRPCGIDAKMNQLQDSQIIRELYRAGRAGVPISLNIRGLCCLRPGVPGLSENIRVFSVVGRFLEHSRVFRFVNGGEPEYFIGSADWMKRNLSRRVETVLRVLSEELKRELDAFFEVYERDNSSAWDCGPDGIYTCRSPGSGEEPRAAQQNFIDRLRESAAREGLLESMPFDVGEVPPSSTERSEIPAPKDP
jgi:polyphosphate kinase